MKNLVCFLALCFPLSFSSDLLSCFFVHMAPLALQFMIVTVQVACTELDLLFLSSESLGDRICLDKLGGKIGLFL